MTPTNIIANISSTLMLNSSNLAAIDPDLALRVTFPYLLRRRVSPNDKRNKKVEEIKLHMYNDHKEGHSRSI